MARSTQRDMIPASTSPMMSTAKAPAMSIMCSRNHSQICSGIVNAAIVWSVVIRLRPFRGVLAVRGAAWCNGRALLATPNAAPADEFNFCPATR